MKKYKKKRIFSTKRQNKFWNRTSIKVFSFLSLSHKTSLILINSKFPNSFFSMSTVSGNGSEWHTGEQQIMSTYRAFSSEKIVARLGVHIGFNHVNVTLRCELFKKIKLKINSNEKLNKKLTFKQPLPSLIRAIGSTTMNDSDGRDLTIWVTHTKLPYVKDYLILSWLWLNISVWTKKDSVGEEPTAKLVITVASPCGKLKIKYLDVLTLIASLYLVVFFYCTIKPNIILGRKWKRYGKANGKMGRK